MSAVNHLNALQKVKKTKEGQWMACSPAHEDKHETLSIKELPDGRILIHCFAECGAIEVLSALGIDFEDLYPESQETRKSYKGQRISFSDAYKILNMEGLVLFHIAKAIQRGEPIETDRLMDCLSRINKVNQMIGLDQQ
jgi:hypothetical protein